MVVRKGVEQEVLPVAEPRGVGLVAWSPLAMGLLTGKYDEGIPDDSRFGREPWAKARYLTPERVGMVRQLKPIADELGISRSQLALTWVLRQSGVSSVITGATKVSQIEENAEAAEVELSAEIIEKIEEILREYEPDEN